MSIQVIGAGLGRTGTMSLKTALEELGFRKCYHMVEVFGRMGDVRTWDAAARGEPVDWDALFDGYRSAVDWPACAFYRELMARYPDAKVILTVRDPDRWYESAWQTIYSVRGAIPKWVSWIRPELRQFFAMVDRIIWDGAFDGRFADRAHAIDVFNRHNERVRREVPADRLLVFEVREGWGPLCAFLGVPVPEGKPFPHLNDTAEFQARIAKGALIRRRSGLGLIALALAVVMGLIAVAAMMLRP